MLFFKKILQINVKNTIEYKYYHAKKNISFIIINEKEKMN